MELVINTYGTAVSRDNEAFLVSNNDGQKRVPVSGVRSILIGKAALITSDAIQLAIENEIEVIFVDKAGNPFGRVWTAKYGSISTIRKGQLWFTYSSRAVDWIKDMIRKKIENQQALLLMMISYDESFGDEVHATIAKLETNRTKIKNLAGEQVADVAKVLRGLEGISSKIYFETLNLFLPEKYRFAQRSQHPATDEVNALLNYGYGVLYGKVEGALISAGIDPYIGILHRDEYNRPVLVYDVIEQYRVWVEYVVFALVIHKSISDDFFTKNSDGSCWLEAMGRRVLIQALNDFFDEVVEEKGVARSRLTQISLYAQNLAQIFKSFQK